MDTTKKPKGKHGGRRPGSGRKPGVPNKLTATVKMMLLEALEKEGGVKYLRRQAKKNPHAFMTLLGKIIPTQVVGDMSYRYVAEMPPPETDPEEWLKRYSPKPTHAAPTTRQ
jgi:hypothetical protein